jgi:murein DD-endopeptidase MepM/ murein hydrolase activator NlpD
MTFSHPPTPSGARAARRRLAAAICLAGIAAGALSGQLAPAGADGQQPVPGESVAQPSGEVAPAPAPPSVPAQTGADAPATPAPDPSQPTDTAPPAATPPAPVPAPAPAPSAGQPGQGTPAAPAPAPAAAPGTRSSVEVPDGTLCEQAAGIAPGERTEAERKAAARDCKQESKARRHPRRKAGHERDRDRDHTPAPQRDRGTPAPLRNAEGTPTMRNPTTSLALPGPAAVGVPNFFIDKFRIPPFLLPIYQAAGTQYGIRWEVLAAINEIETDYGRNLNISSAGALGWMQFMPATWRQYGVDANRDGKKDPFNPVDAIFAAARYLKAAGGDESLQRAIFAYNHADWYVQSVLMRARLIGGLPADLVGSLSGLTQARFPVPVRARYADDLSERDARRRVAMGANAAMPVESDAARRGIDIYAAAGAPVIAVQDGRVTEVGRSRRLGTFVRLRDAYGNLYTYGHLKSTALRVAVPKERKQSRASIASELKLPHDPRPTRAASAGRQTARTVAPRPRAARAPAARLPARPVLKERLFAHPSRPRARDAGGETQILGATSALPSSAALSEYFAGVSGLRRSDVELKPLAPGRRVIAGTILGRIGRVSPTRGTHVRFEIRPSGRGAPRIDPKPILDGWKLLESTAIYRAQGRNVLTAGARSASIGQILLMSKEALQRRVLSNPRIEIYSCGQADIRSGIVDRRVLATLEFLASSGLRPTVTSVRCGHGYRTAGGNVSEHSSGSAVDIAKINGIPILGHQGEGSITDIAVRRLLTLQGDMKPHQIITLMTYKGADNTLAMGDHADHIHVGFAPRFDAASPAGRQAQAVLKPGQWIKLIDRIGQIANPTVRTRPSRYATPVPPVRRASGAHRGE